MLCYAADRVEQHPRLVLARGARPQDPVGAGDRSLVRLVQAREHGVDLREVRLVVVVERARLEPVDHGARGAEAGRVAQVVRDDHLGALRARVRAQVG